MPSISLVGRLLRSKQTKEMKPSPENITSLEHNQVFVFGSNKAGIHGAGAAKQAVRFGARKGSSGAVGQTYGIHTKGFNLEPMTLIDINMHVALFLNYADQVGKEFLVTAIGCGLAGHTPEEIAPMFRLAPDNVLLPQSFINVLK